jgi:DNA repair exonuclease SbcCD ATPase subunit
MHITQVQLRNIGPHRQLDVEMGRGLIGLVGSNGAGKSTLVNAIYAALTNDFSRFSNVKSDIITNGSGKETSYIRIRGVHRGQDFELTRWLRPNKNDFTIGGVSYAKANEVNDAITAQLNISKLVIDKYVFVDQWEMFGFLDQTASERAKTFQYLCGTEVAATIHKVCSDYVTKQKGYEIDDNSLELEESLNTAAASMAEYVQQMKDCQEKMLTDVELKAARALIRKREQADAAQEDLEDTQETMRRWQAEQVRNQQSLDQYLANRAKMEAWLEVRRLRINAAAALLRDREKYDQLQQQQQKWMVHWRNTQANLVQLEEDRRERDDVQYVGMEIRDTYMQAHQTLRVACEQDRKVLDMSAHERSCTLCNQPVTLEYVQQVRKRYQANRGEYEFQATRIAHSLQYDKDMAAYEKNKAKNEADLAIQEAKLAGFSAQLDGFTGEADYAAAEALTAKAAEADARLVTAMSNVRKCEHRQTSAEGQLQALKEVAQRHQATIDQAPTLAAYKRTTKQLLIHEQAAQDYEAAKGALTEAGRSHHRVDGMLKQLRLRLAEKTKIQNLLTTISEAGEVFHWNNLPKTVSQANLELLVGDINENLELFNSPFFVESDSDLTFKVYFPGQAPVKAKQLSGGQKVVLAIAFRAALDRVFGHDVGMMFLDEPTSGLDADNVNFFHEALQQLAQKVGTERQLVVITHVQELGGVFDQLVEIHKD